MSDDNKKWPVLKVDEKKIIPSKPKNATKLDVAYRVVDIMGSVVSMIVEGKVREQESKDRREAMIIELEALDKDAAAFCKKLEGRFKPEQERTERLRILLDYLTRGGNPLPESLASQLIEKFSSCDFRD